MTIKDEEYKVNKFKEENERRQFNYIPFIYELMKILAEKGKLEEMYEVAKEEKRKENNKDNKEQKENK